MSALADVDHVVVQVQLACTSQSMWEDTDEGAESAGREAESHGL